MCIGFKTEHVSLNAEAFTTKMFLAIFSILKESALQPAWILKSFTFSSILKWALTMHLIDVSIFGTEMNSQILSMELRPSDSDISLLWRLKSLREEDWGSLNIAMIKWLSSAKIWSFKRLHEPDFVCFFPSRSFTIRWVQTNTAIVQRVKSLDL